MRAGAMPACVMDACCRYGVCVVVVEAAQPGETGIPRRLQGTAQYGDRQARWRGGPWLVDSGLEFLVGGQPVSTQPATVAKKEGFAHGTREVDWTAS